MLHNKRLVEEDAKQESENLLKEEEPDVAHQLHTDLRSHTRTLRKTSLGKIYLNWVNNNHHKTIPQLMVTGVGDRSSGRPSSRSRGTIFQYTIFVYVDDQHDDFRNPEWSRARPPGNDPQDLPRRSTVLPPHSGGDRVTLPHQASSKPGTTAVRGGILPLSLVPMYHSAD